MELYLKLAFIAISVNLLILYLCYIFSLKTQNAMKITIDHLLGDHERMEEEIRQMRKELDGVEKVQDLLNSQWFITSSSEWGDELGESYND